MVVKRRTLCKMPQVAWQPNVQAFTPHSRALSTIGSVSASDTPGPVTLPSPLDRLRGPSQRRRSPIVDGNTNNVPGPVAAGTMNPETSVVIALAFVTPVAIGSQAANLFGLGRLQRGAGALAKTSQGRATLASIYSTVRGATLSNSTDWYDYLLDALEPEESHEPIFNAAPLTDPDAADEATIRHYFASGLYPYGERYGIKSYYREKQLLQIELVKLQNWIKDTGRKVVLVFEGRDAAGKGSTIKRLMENLNPRGARVVALEKPTDVERGQWYFQRYTDHLPSSGEMVFFDRSWYNRAGVERVMGFCSEEEYWEFTRQAPIFEKMLVASGIDLLKVYLSVSREEQARRFHEREHNPLKQWKLSPVDREAQRRWDAYTSAKETTFQLTDSAEAPWVIVKAEDKLRARLNTMRLVLDRFNYADKNPAAARPPDPLIVAPARLVFRGAEEGA